MEASQRYIIFAIGALLGSLILAFTYSGKYRAIQNQKQTDALNGYSLPQHILPGQDLTAKKPFHTGPAISTKDYPLRDDHTFLRVIIAKGRGPETPLWRIEETLWKDPNSPREKLVVRQIMHPDKLLIRLKENHNDPQQLSQILTPFNMQLIRTDSSSKLYYIQLPSDNIDSLPNSLQLLSSIPIIEKAIPFYINNF